MKHITFAVAIAIVILGGPIRTPAPVPSAGMNGFIGNPGAWDARAPFMSRLAGVTLWAEPDGWTLRLPARDAKGGVVTRMTFEGARGAVAGERLLPGSLHHAATGATASRYERLRYSRLYDGVDVLLREAAGRFEYDLELAPGAALDQVSIRMDGVDALRLDGDALVATTACGELRQPAPLTWQPMPDGSRRPVACRYRLIDDARFGFELDGVDAAHGVIIDPGLEWSKVIDGPTGAGFPFDMLESPRGLGTDANGNLYVIGTTAAPAFPVTAGAFDTTNAGLDAFVVKLTPTGTLVFGTFLGGSAGDLGFSGSVAPTGEVAVCGQTTSTDFPVTFNGFPHNGTPTTVDAFVSVLNAQGTALTYSTCLGGSLDDHAFDVDLVGTWLLVGGDTASVNFPTTPLAFDTTHNGWIDGFLTVIDTQAATSIIDSTFIGGTGEDIVNGVVFPGFFTGSTTSTDLPVTLNAAQGANAGMEDAFAGMIIFGSQVYTTYWGGPGRDFGFDVGVSSTGLVIVGSAWPAFPTTPGAFQTTQVPGVLNGTSCFAAALTLNGGVHYSTYLDGNVFNEAAVRVQVDASGAAIIMGWTGSTDFPTTAGAWDTTQNAGFFNTDAFVCHLDPDGGALLYSTYLGGTGISSGLAGLRLASGDAIVAGTTYAPDFPGRGAALGNKFVTKLDLLPHGARRYGTLSGPGVEGTALVKKQPVAGDATFGVLCSGAPPNAQGLLLVTLKDDVAGTPFMGITLHVDLTTLAAAVSVTSDARGLCRVPFPLTLAATGDFFYVQWVWAPSAGLKASAGMEVKVH